MTPTITRILIATDFSGCARDALEFGLALAAKQGARVTLVHAWSAPPIFGGVEGAPIPEASGPTGGTVTQYIHDEAERELRTLVEELARRGIGDMEHRLLLGDARGVIVAASATHDLVVMGTHGRGGVARVLLGSVADYVVRHAECPVLTVRAKKQG